MARGSFSEVSSRGVHLPAGSESFSRSNRHRLTNIQLMPGSLNWLAMVGYAGTSSSAVWKATRLRFHCLRTSRSASSAPRLSYLLSTMSSAKSSMSIFSSWLAAPYSLVITYMGKSTRSTISESLWPMPAVSTMTRS